MCIKEFVFNYGGSSYRFSSDRELHIGDSIPISVPSKFRAIFVVSKIKGANGIPRQLEILWRGEMPTRETMAYVATPYQYPESL